MARAEFVAVSAVCDVKRILSKLKFVNFVSMKNKKRNWTVTYTTEMIIPNKEEIVNCGIAKGNIHLDCQSTDDKKLQAICDLMNELDCRWSISIYDLHNQ